MALPQAKPEATTPWLSTADKLASCAREALELRRAAAAQSHHATQKQKILQDVRGVMVRADKLAKELPDDESRPANTSTLEKCRLDCARAVLSLTLPGVTDSLAVDRMIKDLLSLHGRLSAANPDGYAFDQLLSALCNYGRIREYGAQSEAGAQDRAVSGLHAIVEVLLESISPGHDGIELNALVGVDAGLDAAIRMLRKDCVRKFMTDASASESQDGPDLASELVDLEFALAKGRAQLLRAMDQGDVGRTMGGIAGLKIDEALVRGLRRSLGDRAQEFGLLIASLLVLERAIAESEGGKRMLAAVKALQGQAQANPTLPADRAYARYLSQRELALTPGDTLIKRTKEDQRGGLTESEVGMLGLSTAASDREVLMTAHRLAERGLLSSREVQAALDVINGVVRALQPTLGEQSGPTDRQTGSNAVGLGVAVLRAGREEHMAKELYELLLNELVKSNLDLSRPEVLRNLVRAAILKEQVLLMRDGPSVLYTFNPQDHLQAAIESLAACGVPIDTYRSEIEQEVRVMDTRIKAEDLVRWAKEANIASDSVSLVNSRAALVDSLDQLQFGTRVRLTSGGRVEIQSGSIALDPTMFTSVNVKAALGTFASLDIAMPDGYEIVFRRGKDVKAGADLTVSPALAVPGVQLSAVATGEASGHDVSGVVLRFPRTPQGREAAKAALRRLLSGEQIEVADLVNVNDDADKASLTSGSIVPMSEKRAALKGGVGVKAGVGTAAFAGEVGSREADATLGARAALQAGLQRTFFKALSTKESVEKSESEFVVEASAAAALGPRLASPNGANGSEDLVLNGSMFEATVTATRTVKHKSKVLFADGRVVTGTERVVQKHAFGVTTVEDADKLAPGFASVLKKLESSSSPAHQRMAAEIRALLADVRTNEVISIASTIHPLIMEEVNQLLSQAQILRANGGADSNKATDEKVQRLRQRARALLDDPANYVIARIAIVPDPEWLEGQTDLNLFFVQNGRYVEAKGEFVAREVKPDPEVARAVHAELLGSRSAAAPSSPATRVAHGKTVLQKFNAWSSRGKKQPRLVIGPQMEALSQQYGSSRRALNVANAVHSLAREIAQSGPDASRQLRQALDAEVSRLINVEKKSGGDVAAWCAQIVFNLTHSSAQPAWVSENIKKFAAEWLTTPGNFQVNDLQPSHKSILTQAGYGYLLGAGR